jgi:acyl-CoA synthetase (AMP-forming)/AMP-acid ligase II
VPAGCQPTRLITRPQRPDVTEAADQPAHRLLVVEDPINIRDPEPRVAKVVVVGLSHERWREAITAVVVPRPGETLDEAELIAALKERLDGYKLPSRSSSLPRPSTGKIQKNVLLERHLAHYRS